MNHEIHGQLAQYASLAFEADETCWAGKSGIMSYSDGIRWRLRVPGGVSGAARRMLSGEGLALVHLHAERRGATTSLASSQPGRIFTWDLAEGPVLTTRGSFLGAWGDIEYVGGVRKALFSGEGLFMTRLTGPGFVLLQTLKRRHEVVTKGA